MILVCKKCDINISKEVLLLNDKSKISMEDQSPYIPEGTYVIDEEDTYDIPPKGEYVLNLNDIVNTKYHKERVSGCCGIAGHEKPNILCENGHEVGTEYSDCWCPWYIHLNPENVAVKAN